MKTQRVRNFLNVPTKLEKFLFIGFLICLDSLLYIFTILPVRCLIAVFCLIGSFFFKSIQLGPSHKCDLLKMLLFGLSTAVLFFADGSQIYHSIRGQAIIKLYVIFNVMDVLNRLGSAFGHDILDSLFSKSSLTSDDSTGIQKLNIFTYFTVALLYVIAHSMILFYQMIALNVAINSYSNSLLPIMLSSNFVEIKSSVFKKCEEKNLFGITCADVVERFHLLSYLFLIIIRNFLEMTGGAGVDEILSYLHAIVTPSQPLVFYNFSFVSTYFGEMFYEIGHLFSGLQISSNYKLFMTLLLPAFYVIGSEILSDNLKHAFITKFNDIPSSIYTEYLNSLYRGLLGISLSQKDCPKWDVHERLSIGDENRFRSPILSRRLGFVAIPLACLFTRILYQTFQMIGVFEEEFWDRKAPWLLGGFVKYFSSQQVKMLSISLVLCVIYIWLLSMKLFISLYLLQKAKKDLSENSKK